MSKNLLITASSFGHILCFHLPYVEAFKNLGWSVTLACGGEIKEIYGAEKLINLPFEKSFFSVENFKASAILRKEIMENDYDLVIMHTSLAAFFTRLAMKGLLQRPKSINVVHGFLFDNKTNFLKKIILMLAERTVAAETDIILTMNEYDTSWAKKAFPGKSVSYIPGMGIDCSRVKSESPSPDYFPKDSVILIYPAEFSKRKNQMMLIKAMAELPENIHLILPGEGLLKEKCIEFACEQGLKQRVHFPGYVKDIFQLLAYSDIAVSASRSEGLPFNLLEAMSMGLPLVASRVKGNKDLIEDGENGYLFEYDDVDGFVRHISKLVMSDEIRRTMGEKNASRVKNFALNNVLPVVMQQYLNDDI